MDSPQGNRRLVQCPRIFLCGLRGGSGKTVLTLGLIGALRRRQWSVAPFKKGPDYIDPQWITLAAGRPCRNLDSFLMNRECIMESFVTHGTSCDLSVIEGNRGLYDGMDADGTYSSAELAIQLNAPIVLVVDCAKITRTAAALVLGCKALNPSAPIAGVILNRIAGERQAAVIRAAIEKETGVPVLGSLRRMDDFVFPERHLGLHPPAESPSHDVVKHLTDHVEEGVDIDAVYRLAAASSPLRVEWEKDGRADSPFEADITIGVIRDEAFHFYYPENLEALEERGARIVEINALRDRQLPPIDALYIGGGFPETQAERLAENDLFRAHVRSEIEHGLPTLAECGGLVYLSESVTAGGKTHPMAGVFPVTYTVSKRPQGHGYTIARVDRENPFFPVGSELRGHEFRYSAVRTCGYDLQNTAFHMARGSGFEDGRDGLVYKNCLASFCHHHACSAPEWAEGIVRLARANKRTVTAPPYECTGACC